MFVTKLKLVIIGVVLICLIPGIAQGQDCVFDQCGDIDGNGFRDIRDGTALRSFLIGGPAPVDSACANVDGKFGITICDMIRSWDVAVWWFNQFTSCNRGIEYSYLPTPEDTIFVPSMSNISENIDKVELPIFISYFDRSGFEAVYLPFLPLGEGSNSAFLAEQPDSLDSLARVFYDIKPDTALHLDVQLGGTHVPVGRVLSGVVRYSRVSTGVGQIVPEIINEFDLKRMALAKFDAADTWTGDLYIPTIKTYAADPCCLAGGGNVDCDPNEVTDIADLTMLIDHLFINFFPLCCTSEANIDLDTDVLIDISDLTALIDHLFISFASIESCQTPYLDD